jgi:phenylacetate-CoA ligase
MGKAVSWTLREAFASRNPEDVVQRQRARLAEIVAHARTHSPYFRDLYRDLPERVENSTLLPVTDKKKLMARFDDWATDREVTIEKARAFAENPELLGERFLGKYTVATTSGTTGTPGLFIIDGHAMNVTNALALRMIRDWIGLGDIVKFLISRRIAMTIAPGGHSATAVAAARLRKSSSGRKRIRVFSVHLPLPDLVRQLNQFRPAVLASYASIAKLLAAEQQVGRLHINPVLVAVSAEGLPPDDYNRIASTLKTKVGNSYAATECTFLSYGCEQRWLHVNSDWVVCEPVDADYRPVPPGKRSHTLLLSNLANRVQPVLRYDLGVSVLQRPDPCPCGNPLPAIRVQGRAAEVLTFSTEQGERVSIPPLAFEVDHIPGIERVQVVQTSPSSLRVRLLVAPGAEPNRVWQAAHTEITRMLTQHQLSHVTVERGEEPPEQSLGGKYRAVNRCIERTTTSAPHFHASAASVVLAKRRAGCRRPEC